MLCKMQSQKALAAYFVSGQSLLCLALHVSVVYYQIIIFTKIFTTSQQTRDFNRCWFNVGSPSTTLAQH